MVNLSLKEIRRVTNYVYSLVREIISYREKATLAKRQSRRGLMMGITHYNSVVKGVTGNSPQARKCYTALHPSHKCVILRYTQAQRGDYG